MADGALFSLIAGVLGPGDEEPRGVAAIVTTTAAGAMAPLHVHDVAEAHHVLEGRLRVHVGEDTVVLRPGQSLVAPAGVAHTHRAELRTRHVTVATVSSAGRYEDWLRAVARPAPALSWAHGAEAAALTTLARANGITVLGPPGTLMTHGAPALAAEPRAAE